MRGEWQEPSFPERADVTNRVGRGKRGFPDGIRHLSQGFLHDVPAGEDARDGGREIPVNEKETFLFPGMQRIKELHGATPFG